ncbi:protein FAR-RED IMPAIRED RESPONSE 1 isoform X2 [Manihot esculenta]|uniref:protein FAR-RED IMPAIRED RESPONSE 1 isoform X2 n=1 Tax=Manihot esculenta TaxID=3983 RepID=UPI000B5D5A83|nr:protein FAR-RED IMPAIRED RESPONSE 1 isoform X2 [Manihot esculenta]
MGIDLQQPSAEYHKQDCRPNANADMGGSGSYNRNRAAVDCCNISGTDKERPTVSGRAFDGTHKTYAGDRINLNAAKDLEPHDGMEFESKEEAFSFYKEYAKSVGFATIIKASRRSRISGKFIDAKFVCTRYGTKRESSTTEMPHPVIDTVGATSIPVKRKRGRINRSLSKTDCKACMHVKRRQHDGRWVVRSFIKEHNHEIFPDQAYFFRGHRNLDLGNNNVDALHAIRARTKKVYVSMSRQSGGYKKQENQKRSLTNMSGSKRHLALDEGDAQIMLEHFRYMQDENPNFFYAMDLNEEQCLRNVLWVDAKARLDYGYFGDVIFFDTTYLKSEYKLPFAPFFGVNHHFQCLLLGCALVADETKSTYVWLMQAWLRAVGGVAPKVILTDQDKSLEQAIAEVFPNSQHCFCLWHLLSKIPEKLSYVIRQHENFMSKLNKCIFKSWTDEQFEKRWWKMVENFNLRNDVWFQSLYEDRQKWMPLHMRDKFLAGMSTTQRSDSISSFLDKHLQRKTSLKEFLEHYKTIIQEKFEEEAKADFETWHKQPGLKSPSPFGKQMAMLYTHTIFKKFQVEVLGVVACHPRKEAEDGETKTFKVQDFEESQDFIVVWKGTSSYFSCSCRSFEFNGFLCRHVLIVMQMSGMHSIPSQYILKRWTKDAKSRETIGEQSGKVESRVQRYNDLCRRAFKLGDEGSLSQESYCIAFSALEEALRKCESVNNAIHNVIEPNSTSPNRPQDYDRVNCATGVSKTSSNDGISRKKQVYSEPDVTSIGMHESWQQLEQLNSKAPNLDGYFGPQQIVQGMLNSIASTRDGYYSKEHSMQRLGQLNTIAPIHEAHFVNQQRTQGMGQLHCRSETIPSCFNTQDGLQEMVFMLSLEIYIALLLRYIMFRLFQDQSSIGPSQLHGMASKNLQPKHLPR